MDFESDPELEPESEELDEPESDFDSDEEPSPLLPFDPPPLRLP